MSNKKQPTSPSRLHDETNAVRHGLNTDMNHGAVIPPLYLTSTFAFDSFGKKGEYDYTRSGNPTRAHFARALAELEGGAGGVVTSSGMSAVHLATQLLRNGEVLVAPGDCYGGCHRLFSACSAKGLFETRWVELSQTDAAIAAIGEIRPRMVWIESPSNPLLRITDIEAIASASKNAGAIVVVDNTFLSPAGQNPISLGADLVVHSTTKYINGHSDVVGGAVIARTSDLAEELDWWANCLGLTGAPFDSYLALRGLRTLHLRYQKHQENAQRIAQALQGNAAVERVYFPGLTAHPGHPVAARQQNGFGAIVSFELKAPPKGIGAFCGALRHFTLAESLGGVESLVAHPATMTHAAMSPEDQRSAGISESLLRLSVGIEDVEDLLADLEAGFAAARTTARFRRTG